MATAKPLRARSRAWTNSPIRYIRIKITNITLYEQKGLNFFQSPEIRVELSIFHQPPILGVEVLQYFINPQFWGLKNQPPILGVDVFHQPPILGRVPSFLGVDEYSDNSANPHG